MISCCTFSRSRHPQETTGTDMKTSSLVLFPALLGLLSASFPADAQQTTESRTTTHSPCGPAGCIVSNDEATDASHATSRRLSPGSADPSTASDATAPTQRATKVPSAAEPMTDFEKFVLDDTGRAVPIFGQELFRSTPEDFLPPAAISPPADYIAGPGDQIKIRTWGNVDMDVTATVDRNGQIFIPQVGAISVSGTRADQMQGTVRSALNKQFRSFDLSVTMGQLRSIQVFVLGEARRPGVYTISSLSTLVNALFASGGPSNVGSLRDIQVKRGVEVLTHFDVYDLLLNGDKAKDIHLQPGDIIYIPLAGPRVAVVGDVVKPSIYELRGATTADQALQVAGGLTAVAGVNRASLDRIVDHDRRTIEDFPLNGAQKLIHIQNGDILRVFPISAKIEKAVSLRGVIGNPGRYPWHAGMRISDLIPNRSALLPRIYYNQQNALSPAMSDHPFAVSGSDLQAGPARSHALTNTQAEAAASTPDVLDATPRSALGNHETEINWNYASIERLGSSDLTTHVFSFNLGDAIDHPASTENRVLEPGDVIMVYSVRDINLPTELRASFVRIDGEVIRPGIYRIAANETLQDLVQRAGGLAARAYPYAAQLNRESVRIAEDLKLRILQQRESQAVFSPVNAPTSSDARSGANDLEMRRAYLEALRQVHATGRVVLQISPTATTAADLPPFALHDEDHFFVPAVPNTVDVLGNVFNQGSLRSVPGMRVGEYLKLAGGHTREADKAHDFILRADGTVLSREKAGHFDRLPLYPGDSVVVPGRFKPGFNLYEALSVGQLASSLALTAVAVSALK